MYKLALKMLFLHWKTHELPGAFPPVLTVGFANEPLAPGLVKGPLNPTSQGLCALHPSIFCKLQKCFLINEAPAIPCPRAPSSKGTPLHQTCETLRAWGCDLSVPTPPSFICLSENYSKTIGWKLVGFSSVKGVDFFQCNLKSVSIFSYYW